MCFCCVDVGAVLDRASVHWARDFTGWWHVTETVAEAERLDRELSNPARLS